MRLNLAHRAHFAERPLRGLSRPVSESRRWERAVPCKQDADADPCGRIVPPAWITEKR